MAYQWAAAGAEGCGCGMPAPAPPTPDSCVPPRAGAAPRTLGASVAPAGRTLAAGAVGHTPRARAGAGAGAARTAPALARVFGVVHG